MTTIDESLTAKGYTPAASVAATFGQARVVKSITIHHWGAFGQTHDGVCNFFATGPGATSAHYVASAGRINCLVNPDDAAWHAGNAEGNATSIGIECRPEASDGDYATVAELVARLRGIYGDVPLRPHSSWSSTACPGAWDLARIDGLARGTTTISTQSVTITSQEDDMPSVSDLLYAPIPKYDVDGNEVGTTTLAEVTAWNEANFARQRRLTVDAVKETVLGVLTTAVTDVATGGTTNLATEVSWLPANFKRDAGGGVDVYKLAESIAAAVVNLSASAEKTVTK